MTDAKITALTELAAAPAAGDYFVIVDVSDTTMSVNGTNKKITSTYLLTDAVLLAGRAGGQTLYGGTAANEDIILDGTSHATKTSSYVILQPSGGNVGIGTNSPSAQFQLSNANGAVMRLSDSGATDDTAVNAYLEYYRGDNTQRVGYVGFPSSVTTALVINNEVSGGDISLLSTGGVTANTTVSATTLSATGDSGGAASTNRFTNVSNVAANSTGVGTIKFKGATSRDSTGFIKIYVGTTAYYIPIFSAITG